MHRTKHPGVYRLPDGRYLIDATGRCPKTGKRKRKRMKVKACDASEAARLREELRLSIVRVVDDPRRVRLAEYALSWFASRAPGLKPSTRDRYARTLDLHILPALGDHYLDALESADIVRWRDSRSGAPSSINGHLRVLRTLLADATEELGLPRSPASRVRALREPKRSGEEHSNRLTAAELGRVLAHLREDEPGSWALIITQAFTGARFGEVSALRWEDIDPEAGVIHIRRSQWLGRVDSTKTDAHRTVPLPEPLAQVLELHHRTTLEEDLPGAETGYCFANAVGGLPYNSTINDHLRAALDAVGIDRRVTSHGLRRTLNNLTRQVATGEVVRSIIGHVTERMTEHYSWVELEEKRAAIGGVLRLVHSASEGSDEAAPTDESDTSCDTSADGTTTAG